MNIINYLKENSNFFNNEYHFIQIKSGKSKAIN